jgi:uncharacterized protein YvpB
MRRYLYSKFFTTYLPPPKKIMKFLNVPHYSQLDNEFHPTYTCNLTKAAMCLAYHGIKPKQRVQLEDELYEYARDNKLSRHVPEDIASIIKAHGCQDRFTYNATIEEVKESIDNGNPCILHGMFTRSGHIVVVRGYDFRGLIVNHPYGEFFRSGYDTSVSGAAVRYSYGLIQETCA